MKTINDLLDYIKGKNLTDHNDEPMKILIRVEEGDTDSLSDTYKECSMISFGYDLRGSDTTRCILLG